MDTVVMEVKQVLSEPSIKYYYFTTVNCRIFYLSRRNTFFLDSFAIPFRTMNAMNRTLSCDVLNDGTATHSSSSLIGAIVVKTKEVSFTVFKANRAVDELITFEVPVDNVQHLPDGWAEQDPVAILRAVRECIANTVSVGMQRRIFHNQLAT